MIHQGGRDHGRNAHHVGTKSQSTSAERLPPYLASLYDVPLLSIANKNITCFAKMNYLNMSLRICVPHSIPKRHSCRLWTRSRNCMNKRSRSRTRLFNPICVWLYRSPNDIRIRTTIFFGLISDGKYVAHSSCGEFDYARGNKFSTYASWAIMKNFARTIPDEFRHRDRFRTSSEEVFTSHEDRRVTTSPQR